jgi:hypothetical protein
MSASIEVIRAATHSDDRTQLGWILGVAYEGGDAHHYLAATMTRSLREALIAQLALMINPVLPKKGETLVSYELWEVDHLPPACVVNDRTIVVLQEDEALHTWREYMRRTALALGWQISAIEYMRKYALALGWQISAGHPGALECAEELERAEDALRDLVYCVECCDVIEAQKASRRVARVVPGLALDAALAHRTLRIVFAETILDRWITGKVAEAHLKPLWEDTCPR